MPKSLKELEDLREKLIKEITKADLKWVELDLVYKEEKSNRLIKMGTIDVCSPVFKRGYFVPVKSKEMWSMAKQFSAGADPANHLFPLTRAVFDQFHNAATRKGGWVARKPMPHTVPQIKDFVTYSEYLKNGKYVTHYGNSPVSGAHKLYLLSAHGGKKTVNYGFHIKQSTPPSQGEAGRYLKDTGSSVINGTLAGHNEDWWDYSQLLQFMKNFRNVLGDHESLRSALLNGDPAIWDEKNVLKELPI